VVGRRRRRRRLAVVQTSVRAGRAVVVDATTAGSRRVLALDAETIAALREHRRRQLEERVAWGSAWVDSGLVFVRENGRPLMPERVTRRFARLARAAGLEPIRVHDLRHSYATAALLAGAPTKVVSQRLGHRTVAMTLDTYSHVVDGLDQTVADLVAGTIFRDQSVTTDDPEAADRGTVVAFPQVSGGVGGGT
jgi:integrase